MTFKWATWLAAGMLAIGVAGCDRGDDSGGSSDDGGASIGASDAPDLSAVPIAQRQMIVAGWKSALREISTSIDEFEARSAADDDTDPEIKAIMRELAGKLKGAQGQIDAAEKASDVAWGAAYADAMSAMEEIQTAFGEAGRKMAAWQAKHVPPAEGDVQEPQ